MLLESPAKRFSQDVHEWKRHMAKIRLKDNLFKSDRKWRDEGHSRRVIINRTVGRKAMAERVSFILKGNDDPLYKIGLLSNVINNSLVGGLETFDRLLDKKFGVSARLSAFMNHKSMWIEPVWANEHWFRNSPYYFYHDVHQSEDDPNQIAYNRNLDNLKRNIQTRTKPGKYLTQYFSGVLSQDQIRGWAQKQIAHATCRGELNFIESDNPEGWIDIYDRGPGSCMRGSKSVQVYALKGNGLRLAYIDSDGLIVARCIVVDASNDDDVKGWVRIYSTDQRWDTAMREMLAAEGYEARTNMNGIKLQLIERNGEYMCPYIDYGSDGEQCVEVHDDFLLVGHGDIDATNTGGWVSQGEYCDECEEHVCCETHHVESVGRNVCDHCLDHYYTYAYGDRYQDWFPNDDVIYCESNGEYYYKDSYGNHDIVFVDGRNEYYHIDDCVCVDVGRCEGEWIHSDDAEQDHISGEQDESCRFTIINGNSVHESYVVSDYVTGEDVDMRECVQIYVGRKHKYAYSDFYKEDIHLYIHQDNLTAEVILSDFVKCGNNLYRNTCYGNPVTCFEPENVIYGDEYTGDKIEDHLVADAEERLAA